MSGGLIVAAAQSASAAGDITGNAARHLRFAKLAAGHGVQILVFPELSLTGYELDLASSHAIHPDRPELALLRQFGMEARMTIVAGAPVRNGGGALNIAALAFRADGSVVTHTKEHVHQSEEHVFTSGPGGPLLPVEEASVALAICADASHPQHAAKAAAGGATLYAAGVMIDEEGHVRKTALLATYARRHGMAVLMANYSGTTGGYVSAGKSAIWSEDGTIAAASTGIEEALIVGIKSNGSWSGAVVPFR